MIKSTRNQIGNAKNPFQGDARKVLCVCSAGLLRSPTLANLLHRKFGYNTRSAGSSDDFALVPVSEALVEWADEIVFVHQDNLDEAPIECLEKCRVLNIEDFFDFGDPDLERQLLRAYIGSEE